MAILLLIAPLVAALQNGEHVAVLPPANRNGIVSYARAMAKYNSQPSLKEAMSIDLGAKVKTALSSKLSVKATTKNNAGAQPNGNQVGFAPSTGSTDDSQWLTQAAIGNPPQTMLLNLDTGSADFWVMSQEVAADSGLEQAHYTPGNSRSAAVERGLSWNITYADKSGASGIVGSDTLWLGGIPVQNQAVQRATTISDNFFSSHSAAGLLGLSFGKLNTVKPQPVATPMDNMLRQNLLQQPLFTVKLVDNGDGVAKQDGGGHFTFGYIDQNAFVGQLSYTPVDTTAGFWEINSPYMRIGKNGVDIPRPGSARVGAGGQSSQLASRLKSMVPSFGEVKTGLSFADMDVVSQQMLGWGQQLFAGILRSQAKSGRGAGRNRAFDGSLGGGFVPQHSAIIDTGTTLMLLDDMTVLTIHQQIKGAQWSDKYGGFLIPCKGDTPDIFFMVGSSYAGVPGSTIPFAAVENGMCYSGIQSRGTMDRDIYGDVFLKSNYVAFVQQQGQEQIGVAWRPDTLPLFR